MPYLELTVDNVTTHFWQSGQYFFRQYEQKQKRNVFQLRNICLHTRRIMEFEISDEFSKL